MVKNSSFLPAALPLLLMLVGCASEPRNVDWRLYGGNETNSRYSSLDQINRENVKNLDVAWTYDTGDAYENSEMQCNPLIINGVLYGLSPKMRVFALDAATGKEIWSFDPNNGRPVLGKKRSRGLQYWESGDDKRLFIAVEQWLYALNATTGKPVEGFGTNGRVDLREGLGRDIDFITVSVSTPGVIYRDRLILGSIVSEGLPSAPGDIRAFDVRTGKLAWQFHTIPHPGEFGYDTWPPDAWKTLGGANSWSGLTLDAERGIVFAPTGSAASDFYGANRVGDNLFADTLLALDANTGQRKWHFQFVKHDTWDRDLPSAPALVTVERDGKRIAAVAQATKSGFVWVFDRETGESLFPFEEVAVPPSDVPGEVLAKKQVLPLKPAPFARQQFTEDMISNRTPEVHADVLARYKGYRNGPQFTPSSLQGTILLPGFDGGAEWGGQAFDPDTGLYYVNANEMAWVVKLVERKPSGASPTGKSLYSANCASCHKDDLSGEPPEFPALTNLAKRAEKAAVEHVIRSGRGRMPGFGHLGNQRISAILRYLMTGESVALPNSGDQTSPYFVKYTLDGYIRFEDADGYPVITPPWGTLNAINLNTGEYAWKVPLGEIPALAEKGMKNTGSENYGGPVVTKGGVLFIAATNYDKKIRAFDKLDGTLLWEHALPAAGNATPATYMVNGKQYLVIAAGGGKWRNPSGGSYVAFALKQ
ncbi:MAG: PQQ-binding-like beta-propeller repeat protein [Bryobacterales bacterium]|nr:PQQ-binding-like beta-propeller repeat protein [Bryobacterales bacterium]